MSDRIAVMDGGRVLQVGAPDDIYDRPRTRFVADFIGDTNLLPMAVTGPKHAQLPDGTTVRVEHDAATGAELTGAIRPEAMGLVAPDVTRDESLDAVEGTVDRVVFLGNARSYDVVVPGAGDPVHVQVRQGNAPGIHHFEVGDRVRVRWTPTSLTPLDD